MHLQRLKPCALLLLLLPALAPASERGQPELRAQLIPSEKTTLSAELNARITHLPYRPGESFKRGDLLAAFDCAQVQGELQRAQAEHEHAARKLQINRELNELKSIDQLAVLEAETELKKHKAELLIRKSLVSKCRILAPFSGKVVTRKADPHQFVSAGTELMTLVDEQNLDLEIIVPSNWLSWVRPKTAFEMLVEETGKRYPGQIERIGAVVDAVSQTIQLTGRITGRHPELLPGMSGTVTLQAPDAQQAPR